MMILPLSQRRLPNDRIGVDDTYNMTYENIEFYFIKSSEWGSMYDDSPNYLA